MNIEKKILYLCSLPYSRERKEGNFLVSIDSEILV